MEQGLIIAVIGTIILALGSCATQEVDRQASQISATVCADTEGRICPEYKPTGESK